MKESDTTKEEIGIKKAVELMRQGATMLNEACPECSGPLFQLKDDIICPQCERKVLIVSDEADVQEYYDSQILSDLEHAINTQLKNLTSTLSEKATDSDELSQIGRLIIIWLEALEKLKRLRSQ